ncbi:MAG: hypothetical protein JF604_19480 [Bradyrhizobium sp.]|nr:hypothetical protein [Bradyrhizobium sp.]
MKPVKVLTVQVKAGQMKLASAGPSQPAPPVTNAIPPAPAEVAETSSAVVAKAETKPEMTRPEVTRAELPPQPANHGTGNGVLGVLPASSVATPPSQALAYADPAPRAQPQTVQQNAAIKPAAVAAAHTGWIIADSFTEPVVAKDNRKLFRARFAGLERDQAEAICRTLKRADISCITVRN